MSGLGAARCPRLQKGRVWLSRGRHNGSIRVLFDGYQSPASLQRDYIEQIPFTEV
jgi:hypothetical protein